MLLLTLPGPAFLYQGDEIGQGEGQPGEARFDRAGRDRHRHPMQWDAQGGFTTGEPWLPLTDPAQRNVADQRDDPRSMLSLVRALIELRHELGDGFELLDAAEGVVAFRRGAHTVAINTTSESLPAPFAGEPRIQTQAGVVRDGMIAPHAGSIALG